MITIHGHPASTYTRTLRMACLELGIGHQVVVPPFGTPEHAALHAWRKMPTLTDGEVRLFETMAALAWIDRDPVPALSVGSATAGSGDRMVLGNGRLRLQPGGGPGAPRLRGNDRRPCDERCARCARHHDAFASLVEAHQTRVRGVVRRLVGHPEEVEELYQEALLKAWRAVDRFRGGSAFGTWLVQIASRTALDHLRRRRRWRTEAQPLLAQACREDQRLAADVVATFTEPGFAFDAREHVAFCFTCVARTLPPEQQVAVVLRDVVGLSVGSRLHASSKRLPRSATPPVPRWCTRWGSKPG